MNSDSRSIRASRKRLVDAIEHEAEAGFRVEKAVNNRRLLIADLNIEICAADAELQAARAASLDAIEAYRASVHKRISK